MERRMKRIILAVLWMTFTLINFASCTEVSSQINFGLEQNSGSLGDPDTKVVVDFNKITGRSEHGYLRSCGLKKRTSNLGRDDSTKLSNVIDNIQIIINGQEIKPSVDGCQNGFCKVSVSSTCDDEGNIITDVHLRMVTKAETDLQINDIPVVDGLRGVETSRDQPVDHHHRIPSSPSTYLRNNFPQIQTRFRDGEPWYQGGRNFQRPQIIWHYHRPINFAGGRFPQYGGRPAGAPVVDDKIEAPLSKTKGNND